jgi:hypothetical protein
MSKRKGKAKRLGGRLLAQALLVLAGSAAFADSQPEFDSRYFYSRGLAAELLIKEAIAKRSGDRALTLYNSLADEALALSTRAKSPDACFEAFYALIPVALMAYGRLAPDQAHRTGPTPSDSEASESLDRAWMAYRERRVACHRLNGRAESAPILPERLSEAF